MVADEYRRQIFQCMLAPYPEYKPPIPVVSPVPFTVELLKSDALVEYLLSIEL